MSWEYGDFLRLRAIIWLYNESSDKPELIRAIDTSFVNDNSIEFAVDGKVARKKEQVFLSDHEAEFRRAADHQRDFFY